MNFLIREPSFGFNMSEMTFHFHEFVTQSLSDNTIVRMRIGLNYEIENMWLIHGTRRGSNMKFTSTKKVWAAFAVAGVVGIGASLVNSSVLPVQQVEAAAASQDTYASEHALQTLMSFYKPALEGQFPGAVSNLTVGKSTRKDVFKAIGDPEQPREDVNGYDIYSANMGNPGYAITYQSDKIREIRYFGTNVESQTNIGGITMSMVKQHWFTPNSTTAIKNGKTKQTKLTYIRGDYKVEFIFNSSTNLDHINLLAK